MIIHLADQTVTFLYACLMGAALGLLYDVFRISRVAFPTHKIVVFVEDIVFFLVCAGTTFLFLMGMTDGRVRVFTLIGELIGAVLYYFTVGQLVMKAARAIIYIIGRILHFIYRYFLYPIWWIIYRIVSIIILPFQIIGKNLKKASQKAGYGLKVRRIMLYNHIRRRKRDRLFHFAAGKQVVYDGEQKKEP